jgi:hypothetical protein
MLSKPRLALIIFALVGTFVTSSSRAQSYQPLRSQGLVPEEFRSVTANKVQQAQAEDRSTQRTKEERRHVNDFLLKANYVIDEMLASGKILFGDPVTQYLNDIADALLEDDPQLRSKLKFYAVKSSDANAFATKQGLIFVTLGLIAQVENEAQLAFVIAHEIAHFQKDHSINSVLENARIVNQTSADRYNGNEQRIQLLSTFSKDMEFEADSLGFIRFVLSGYNKYDASSAMDVLYLSSLPYLEKPFQSNYFSFGLTPFSKDFELDSIRPFPYGSDDYDDSKSSHPNIRKRKSRLDAMADRSNANTTLINLLPVERFESIQRTSRDELIHLFLLEGQYVDALYSAYVRISDEPENRYLQESIAKSLYGLSKYKAEKRVRMVGLGSKKSYGEIQQLYYFIETISAEQMNVVAVRYIADLNKESASPFLERLLDDLMSDLYVKHKIDAEKIRKGIQQHEQNLLSKVEVPQAAQDSTSLDGEVAESKEAETKTASKYEKYRKTKVEVTTKEKTDQKSNAAVFHFSYLEPIMTEAFVQRLDSIRNRTDERIKNREDFEAHLKKKEKYYKRNGYSLGIDKVVFVDPFFFLVDRRKGLKLEDSEKGLMVFKDRLVEAADAASLESEVLFTKTMSEDQVDRYNHMSLMNDWVGEKLTHNSNGVNMIPLETAYTENLVETYGTEYFCYTGALTGKEKRGGLGVAVVTSLFAPYLIPFFIIRACVPKPVTNYYYLLYNVRSGETVWTTEREFNLSGTSRGLQSVMYDVLRQTKKTK